MVYPLRFKTPEDMQVVIDSYFASLWEEEWEEIVNKDTGVQTWVQQFNRDGTPKMKLRERPMITGLSMALGINRATLLEYEKRDGYSEMVKAAKAVCEYYYEKGANAGEIHPAVAIFGLKNYGWTDVVQLNTTVQHEQLREDDIRKMLTERKKSKLLTDGNDDGNDNIIQLTK